MDTHKIAQEIKNHLVQLAADDKLPLDMTQLDIQPIVAILNKAEQDKDAAIEHATHYLCDSDDLTMEEQIRAIVDHATDIDGTDFIDDVEGVVVWEKLQHSITCYDFLEMIGWKYDF